MKKLKVQFNGYIVERSMVMQPPISGQPATVETPQTVYACHFTRVVDDTTAWAGGAGSDPASQITFRLTELPALDPDKIYELTIAEAK